MINELYRLSEALSGAGIETEKWYNDYGPLPGITDRAPCYRIVFSDGKIVKISLVDKSLGKILRRYGGSHGTYPNANFKPLFRITDSNIKKILSNVRPEELDSARIAEIKSWCIKSNWDKNFLDQFRRIMRDRTTELSETAAVYPPLKVLIEETSYFVDAKVMFRALEGVAFEMLGRHEGVAIALGILFDLGASNDNISVAFESQKLIETGIPATSETFVSEMNRALHAAKPIPVSGGQKKKRQKIADQKSCIDAFGVTFVPNDAPMPKVKLAGGFDASLRTMFDQQESQRRYNLIGSLSYPLASKTQSDLKSSLEWLSNAEHKWKTWLDIGTKEILFAYPERLPALLPSFVDAFGPTDDSGGVRFVERARRLVSELRMGKEPGTDPYAGGLQIFILRKVDRGRTKVIYTRHTDAAELEQRCEAWSEGCMNQPRLSEKYFGGKPVIYPMDVSDILNRIYRRHGELAAEHFKPVPKYHGMELLLEAELPVSADLHSLAEQAMNVGGYVGNQLARKEPLGSNDKRRKEMPGEIRDMLTLLGLLLYREGIGKEKYMESLPYLYGQLLKISDELHALYCRVVRGGDVPPQLAGSGLYPSAAEAPVRTLNLLALRMSPYITWAKSYRYKGVNDKGKKSSTTGWLLSLYEGIASKLKEVWQPQTRFSDEEKAELFLGYLAEFPKRERSGEANSDEANADMNETTDEDQGGND